MASTATKAVFRCAECGWQAGKWVGRCGECQAWGTVAEVSASPARLPVAGPVSAAARPMTEIDLTRAQATPTGVGELDRVLGGGLVAGCVVLLAGEPGVGKSTLLLQMASSIAANGGRALYVTGEESVEQVRSRAQRVGAVHPDVLLAAEVEVSAVAGHVESVAPDVLVVDSIQTMVTAGVEGVTSGVSQVREAAAGIIRLAKERRMASVLVGHVTKDGSIAGPRTLEHLVDVVLSFEGDRHARLRLVRSVKNRFGPTDEVGCFELGEEGLVGLPDPSGLFVSERSHPVPGTCLTMTLEGRRPLLTEIQALAVPSGGSSPRRTTSGMDGSRIALVLAVLERRESVPLSRFDTYVAPVGGARLTEPAADLSVAIAVHGSVQDLAVPMGWAAIAEVGLSGDLRSASGVRQRVAEAVRLGLDHVIVSPRDAQLVGPVGLRVHAAADLGQALRIIPWTTQATPSRPHPSGPRALSLVLE